MKESNEERNNLEEERMKESNEEMIKEALIWVFGSALHASENHRVRIPAGEI